MEGGEIVKVGGCVDVDAALGEGDSGNFVCKLLNDFAGSCVSF